MEIIKKSEILEEYYNHFPLTDFFSFNIHPYISVVKFESDEKILNEGDKSAYLFIFESKSNKKYLQLFKKSIIPIRSTFSKVYIAYIT